MSQQKGGPVTKLKKIVRLNQKYIATDIDPEINEGGWLGFHIHIATYYKHCTTLDFKVRF